MTSLLLAAAGAGNGQITSRDRITKPIDTTQSGIVRGTAHPLARSEFDQGRVSPERQLNHLALSFRLSSAQQADLNQLLRDQQDPSSPKYHKWLTPEQYAARFGMTANDLAKVSAWLQSQGLSVEGISRNGTEIFFSGSVGQVEYALKTELHNYSINGELHFANATDVSLPRAFSEEVFGVRGLNDFRPKPRVRKVSPRFTSSVSGSHFLAPGDIKTIYDIPSQYDGSGQKIVVVGQTEISNTDIDAFRSASGLAKSDPTVVLVPNTGALTVFSDDETEADLDNEWTGAIAANASIIYVTVGSDTNFSVFDSLTYAVQQDLAPVVSISYGNCETALGRSAVLSMQQTAQQANAQGQTIVGPAGDDGAADCDSNVTSATHGLTVDVPASIPEVTGVGGTEFNGDAAATVSGGCAAATTYWSGSCSATSGASALSYIPEKAWNDLVNSSGFSTTGGGASSIFAKPSWQAGTGVPADGERDVPDLAFSGSASHDGYLICSQEYFANSNPPETSCSSGFRTSQGNLAVIGGTSADAPIFAGIMALINQAAASKGQGNANPMLYSLAGSGAFHDITSGDNKVPCTAGSTNCPSGTSTIGFSAGTGYDQVTGLGSVDVSKLIAAWLAAGSTADFSLDGQVSTVAAPGQQGTSTITVTAMNGFTGTVSLSCQPSSTNVQITCSLNPTSVDLSSTKTGTSTLTISTVARLDAPNGLSPRSLWLMSSGGLFAAVVLGGITTRRRWTITFGILLLAMLVTIVACGGGGSSHKSTPAGTYTVSVTGTSGSTTHNASVSLTVQ